MEPLVRKIVTTPYGEKSISVYAQDIAELQEHIDVLAVSAFYRGYYPDPKTLIGALSDSGISVQDLSCSPEIDLREQCNIWLSKQIQDAKLPIHRIGCIEMTPYDTDRCQQSNYEAQIISSIQAYFHMLHIASLSDIDIETIALPILGSGSQKIDPTMVNTPIINECFRFLKNNEKVKRIFIICKSHLRAFQFAFTLENSYSVIQETRTLGNSIKDGGSKECRVFISYSSKDRVVADNICCELEKRGIKVWYAPRNIDYQDYASAIVDAIAQCTHFVIVVSEYSLQSNHVLNEIDLAFKELKRCIRIIPLRIDKREIGAAFSYYLSRQHWTDASSPPLEKRIEEFASSFFRDGEGN